MSEAILEGRAQVSRIGARALRAPHPVKVVCLPHSARAVIDPRASHVAWCALRVTAVRPAVITSGADLSQALRGMADVLLHSYEANRTAAFTRIETRHDSVGRVQLELSLAVGVLGDQREAAADAEHVAAATLAALQRHPAPFNFDRLDPATLLTSAPRHCAGIGQRLLSLGDESEEACAVSRWDHPQLETWAELADLFLHHPAPLVMQASFAATELSAAEALELEHNSRIAEQIRLRAAHEDNPVVARRAARMVETLADLAESYSGPLWAGGVFLGSPEPLPRPLLRAVANAISSELDVLHVGQAAPVVAARARLVGGYEIDYAPAEAASAFRLGLPPAALRPRRLHELFSATEAGLAFRFILGRVPTLPFEGAPALAPPADIPTDGVKLGRDSRGSAVYLGGDAAHFWLQGATGAGKSTATIAAVESCIELGIPFVLLDPHGTTARAARHAAAARGREVGLFDPREPLTLALDLLGGIDVMTANDDEVAKVVGRAVVDAASSHIPDAWTGVRWQQLARAAGEIAIRAPAEHELRYEDIGRLMIDEHFLAEVLDDHPRADSHSALVLRQLTREQDKAGTGLWASAKFDSIARSAIARALFAPFGHGVSVQQLIEHEIPLVADLSDGSRLETRLAGHIFLTSVLDYLMARPPAERTPLYVLVDEAAIFPAVALARALAEGRKFGLRLFIANQSLSQLDEELADALNANAGRIMFRLGLRDAHLLAPLMGVAPDDLTGLANLHALVQLPGRSAFSVRLDPPETAGELPQYATPTALAEACGPALDGVPARRQPGEVLLDPSEELWAEVIDRLDPDLSCNPRRNWWLQSIVRTRIDGDRFEIVFDSDIVCAWFSQCHLERVQAVVDDIAYGALEVVALSSGRDA
jgi:DNA helicase HerA-like ATPase